MTTTLVMKQDFHIPPEEEQAFHDFFNFYYGHPELVTIQRFKFDPPIDLTSEDEIDFTFTFKGE